MANRLSVIFDDLKSSWYFRIWALLWVVFVITGFVGIIHFGKEATRLSNESTQRSYLLKTTEQQMPTQISFLLLKDPKHEYEILDLQCTTFDYNQSNATVTTLPSSNCLSLTNVDPNTHLCRFVAPKLTIKSLSEGIDCHLTLNNTVEGDHVEILLDGDSSRTQKLYRVGTRQTISLTKVYIDSKTPIYRRTSNEMNADGAQRTDFYANIQFQDLYEHHTVTEDVVYSRWESAADIGGFGFFLFCLHKIIMFILSHIGRLTNYLNLIKLGIERNPRSMAALPMRVLR